MTPKPKILWGVCGIGHGHIFRQLPLIEYFSRDAEIVIFAYGESYDFYKNRFREHANVSVVKVAVPFYVGTKDGLDFLATFERLDSKIDYAAVNANAMAQAQIKLGRPDLVVSDYEPISAQYAYACNAPLVTIDQQSKYLSGDFPETLNGQSYADEIMRLRLFFPKAEERLACSFFKVAQKADASERVTIYPPILNEKIRELKRQPDKNNKSILVYISAQQPSGQSFGEMNTIFEKFPDVRFHVFGKNLPDCNANNTVAYDHGDPKFFDVLSTCNGIVTTAGHTLLSEAMHLGIPVYAMPLPLYEQQMNAQVIEEGGFGLSCKNLDPEKLSHFLEHIDHYSLTIASDCHNLMRIDLGNALINHLSALLCLG